MYRRLKTKHCYIDAIVEEVTYRDRNIMITVTLSGYGDGMQGSPATLTFFHVKNFDEVRETLDASLHESRNKAFLDEIHAIDRDEHRGIRVYFTFAGTVWFDCSAPHET